MSKILIETQYFPTIAFFAWLHLKKQLVIDQHENYHKGSFRNRTKILSSQGALSLSVPLQSGKNSQTNIREVRIDEQDNWRLNHLRSIEACYGKSPYFEFYIDEIRSILESKCSFLFDMNLQIMHKIYSLLGLECRIELSESFITSSDSNIDLKRDIISPKKKLKTPLEPFFVFQLYDQVFSDELAFEPNLSILDLIFCLGPEARLYLASIIRKE